MIVAFSGVAVSGAETSAGAIRGQPVTRFYTLDEIGDISRGARLSFDRWNRLVAVQGGAYHTLNDEVWLNAGPKAGNSDDIESVAKDIDGTMYYGALGSWGVLEKPESGQFITRRLAPRAPPRWVLNSNFNDILCRPEGIYFAGTNAVVFWNRATKQCDLLEFFDLAGLFSIGENVYVSSHTRGVFLVDVREKRLRVPDPNPFGTQVVDRAAELPGGRTLVSTTGRSLYFYKQDQLEPFTGPLKSRLTGKITALQPLLDGNLAVAVANSGLYIITPEGDVVTSLTDLDYRTISSLATGEAGVIWAATENGIAKILYNSPVTSFGQALGLQITWPQVVQWDNRTIISSAGRFYESVPSELGEPTSFRPVTPQPGFGAWGIAVYKDWLLAGTGSAVYCRKAGQPFTTIVSGIDAARLVVLDSGICLAIGRYEIIALQCKDGVWSECAPRIAGVGYPSVVHAAGSSIWVEVGANCAARLSVRDGVIQARVFNSFPWPEPRWVNVSVVGDIVVLAGDEPWRLFFDEKTESFVSSVKLEEIFKQCPAWALRVQSDNTGVLWASYAHGIFTLTPNGDKYNADTTTYAIVKERSPIVQTFPGPEVWVSSGSSLYHIDRPLDRSRPPTFVPRLVSMRDINMNNELLTTEPNSSIPRRLAYSQNNLILRFFAGSYASRHSPAYEFRVNHSNWSQFGSSSLLTLSDLREGDYNIDVRLMESPSQIGPTTSLNFLIAPPWFRTWVAYLLYSLVGLLLLLFLIRLLLRRASARNAVLESMVEERTEELKTTMEKLQQETRTAATLVERNRLAGEIHDSLEQGFSGLIYQLETTADLAASPQAVRGGLTVARNMVAFCRNELRHAVWDLHSPRLESGGLETALRSMVAELAPGSSQVTVMIDGRVRPLGVMVEHHLLRIAQEAITNAIKHAAAPKVEVKLSFGEFEVVLEVQDNGRGFDPQNIISDPAGHFGLRSLRGRANKIGGTISVISKPGSGTSIRIRLNAKTETN